MYVVNNIDSLEVLVRKRIFGFMERLNNSDNTIIKCINNSWRFIGGVDHLLGRRQFHTFLLEKFWQWWSGPLNSHLAKIKFGCGGVDHPFYVQY